MDHAAPRLSPSDRLTRFLLRVSGSQTPRQSTCDADELRRQRDGG